ncbi:helix-turn-helix transcriptional regulator [Tateyamaria sp.]|uniref:helix-turn-helix transcriptional regulator n=1 Tax=Tateyamaria sp. TaxID=1929288 RepID=UPI0032A140AA
MDKILRRDQVLEITGLAKSTLYRMVQEGRFPAPVKMGPRISGWRMSAIQQWIDDLQ